MKKLSAVLDSYRATTRQGALGIRDPACWQGQKLGETELGAASGFRECG